MQFLTLLGGRGLTYQAITEIIKENSEMAKKTLHGNQKYNDARLISHGATGKTH